MNVLLQSNTYNSLTTIRSEALGPAFEGNKSDPILNKSQVLDLVNRSFNISKTIHGELELDSPLVDAISFVNDPTSDDSSGIFSIASFMNPTPNVKIIVKGYPNIVSGIQDIIDMPDSTFFRLIWGNGNEATLHAIEDRAQYMGNLHSRCVSIFGSAKTNKTIVERKLSVKDASSREFYDLTFKDSVFEHIRESQFIIVGGGTVGMVAADTLSRLGATEFCYFELPDELNELPNTQRLLMHNSKQLWVPKWRSMMSMILGNNPYAKVEYMGAFDDGSNTLRSKWISDTVEKRIKDVEGNVYVIMALDQMKHREYAYKVFKDNTYVRMAPTDIGNGTHLQIHTQGEDFTIPEGKTPLHSIIQMLGGNLYAASNFDLGTIKAFFALGGNAYGAFPQSHTSAYSTAAVLAAAITRLAAGKSIPKTVFNDPNRVLETNRMIDAQKRSEVLTTLEA